MHRIHDRPAIEVVYVQANEKDFFMTELAGIKFKPYQKVIPVLGPMTEIYPVNILRNIGIAAVETSHFLVADVDTWPSGRNMLMRSF